MKTLSTYNRLRRKIKLVVLTLYEKYKGLDTPKDRSDSNLFEYTGDMCGYEPSNWLTMQRISKTIPISPSDVFADFGSGKGKMVYLAAQYPFKKVIGIEISKQLHDIARKNIDHTQKKSACQHIDLVNTDVLDYKIPDDLTIAYFFNPFVNEIFTSVINNIHHSFQKNPRPIWIVYKNPKMRQYLDRCDWLEFKTLHHNIAFYRTRTDPSNPFISL